MTVGAGRQGVAPTAFTVGVREQRYSFYRFGGACLVLCSVALLWLWARAVLLAEFSAALLAVAIATLVNRIQRDRSLAKPPCSPR